MLVNTLKNHSLIYIARDIERALGMAPGAQNNYYIITNNTPYSREIQQKYPDSVFIISATNTDSDSDNKALDTYELIIHKQTEEIINKIKNSDKEKPLSLLVFKNTNRIEAYCKEKQWHLANPSAALAETVENKITQVNWLDTHAKHLPSHEILKIADIQSSKINRPYIIQWAHSHTGLGTLFVPAGKSGDKLLAELEAKFPAREARVTEYIPGPMFTVNVCVGETISIGNISYQITGMLPFTDSTFATIGNDWGLIHSILDEAHIAKIESIARDVGEQMQKSGWKGLFGIDCIYDEGLGNIHLIEINARQAASTTYESQLQQIFRNEGVTGRTIFEAHIDALLSDKKIPDEKVINTKKNLEANKSESDIIHINDGAQIIYRVPTTPQDKKEIKKIDPEALRNLGYTVVEYMNTEPGSDLLRIQSIRGIMDKHNKLNARGKEILDTIML